MELAINSEDCDLLRMLLSKEEVGTSIEMHHCRTREYKELLKRREHHLHSLLERIEQASPEQRSLEDEESGARPVM